MIIGIKEKDRVVLGFAYWTLQEVNARDKVLEDNLPFKVFKDEDTIIACAEREIATDMLFTDENIETMIKEGKTTYEDVVNDFAPMIHDKMAKENLLLDDGNWSNCFVVAKGNSIVDVTPTFFVQDVADFFVHGFTTEYSKSNLLYSEGKPAEERIIEAFQFHTQMTCDHTFPIVLIDTKDFQMKVITE